jgi:hypothetical protein
LDGSTFEVLIDHYYAKDKNYVYSFIPYSREENKIKGADPDTFETLSFQYAKDKNNVYYFGNIMK